MKIGLLVVTFLNCLLFQAAELNYAWKANTTYQFSATQKDEITTSMMGMNMTDKFTTTVDFVLFINSVDASGTANGRLFLINYSVKNASGVSLASLNALPKDAVQSEVKVDKKGHFTFLKKVTMITTPTGNYLVYTKSDDNTIMASAGSGSSKMEVYAEFDPKTGALKSSYTKAGMTKTQAKNVPITEESDEINVFPYDYLELLVVPDGSVNQGDSYKVKAGFYTVDAKVKSIAVGLATIDQVIATDKTQDQFSGAADVETTEGSMQIEEFGGMEGMELEPEDEAALGMSKAMSPEMNGTIQLTFDTVKGMFSNVKGNLTTVIDVMGMKMQIKSQVEMKKIN